MKERKGTDIVRPDDQDHGVQLHPLFEAIGNRQTDLLVHLIENGADLSTRQPVTRCYTFAAQRRFTVIEKDSTPLHLAAILNDVETVALLLERGADCSVLQNSSGLLPAEVTRSGAIKECIRDEERRRDHRYKRIPLADLTPCREVAGDEEDEEEEDEEDEEDEGSEDDRDGDGDGGRKVR